jgi:hypothetical protein
VGAGRAPSEYSARQIPEDDPNGENCHPRGNTPFQLLGNFVLGNASLASKRVIADPERYYSGLGRTLSGEANPPRQSVIWKPDVGCVYGTSTSKFCKFPAENQ